MKVGSDFDHNGWLWWHGTEYNYGQVRGCLLLYLWCYRDCAAHSYNCEQVSHLILKYLNTNSWLIGNFKCFKILLKLT